MAEKKEEAKGKEPTTLVLNTLNGHIECDRCGETYHFNRILPLPVNVVAAFSKAYAKNHRRCIVSARGAEVKAERERMYAEWKAKSGTQKEALNVQDR